MPALRRRIERRSVTRLVDQTAFGCGCEHGERLACLLVGLRHLHVDLCRMTAADVAEEIDRRAPAGERPLDERQELVPVDAIAGRHVVALASASDRVAGDVLVARDEVGEEVVVRGRVAEGRSGRDARLRLRRRPPPRSRDSSFVRGSATAMCYARRCYARVATWGRSAGRRSVRRLDAGRWPRRDSILGRHSVSGRSCRSGREPFVAAGDPDRPRGHSRWRYSSIAHHPFLRVASRFARPRVSLPYGDRPIQPGAVAQEGNWGPDGTSPLASADRRLRPTAARRRDHQAPTPALRPCRTRGRPRLTARSLRPSDASGPPPRRRRCVSLGRRTAGRDQPPAPVAADQRSVRRARGVAGGRPAGSRPGGSSPPRLARRAGRSPRTGGSSRRRGPR